MQYDDDMSIEDVDDSGLGSVAMTEPEFEFLSDARLQNLNYKKKLTYALRRRAFIEWMREYGRNPAKGKPLGETTVENYAYRLHQILEWMWDYYGYFTPGPSQEQADEFIVFLDEDEIRKENGDPYSGTAKRKFSNTLEKWFEYRQHVYGADEWEPPRKFSDNAPENPADYFTKPERKKLYDASLEYRSPPRYENLSPSERDEWKATLAQQLGKPKEEVRKADFRERRTCWKIPSLVGATLDGALRPIEIHRANIGWFYPEKGELHIPPDLAAKKRENCTVTLRDRTIMGLLRWKKQRTNYDIYDGRDALWLNQKGNRYTSKNLNNLLDNLLEEADINPEDRKLVWYSFRKSTGQYVHSESDDTTTAKVLRSTVENVQNYSDPTPEEMRALLERMED